LNTPKDYKDFRRKITEARKLTPQNPPGWLLQDSNPSVDMDVSKLIASTQPQPTQPSTADPAIIPPVMPPVKHMPRELRKLPGFLGEYVAFCMEAAPYPNEPLALAGGLAGPVRNLVSGWENR
jgi:hypothetical protein